MLELKGKVQTDFFSSAICVGKESFIMKTVETIIAGALAADQKVLDEYYSKKILAEYGIPTTQEALIENLDEAEAAADQFSYPVVLKVCAAEAAHKTEQGLIELGINDKFKLKLAYERLSLKARDLGGKILIQEMVTGSRELVIGMTRDFHLALA